MRTSGTEKEKADGFARKTRKFLSSVKLAVIIFAVISLVSIVGSIIPQQTDKAIKLLSGVFSDNTAPSVYNILLKLGITDIFSSWWYVALLSLLVLNIIICSFDRLPGVLKIIKEPVRPLNIESIRNMPLSGSVILGGKGGHVRDKVRAVLKSSGFCVSETAGEHGCQLYSHKGRWSRLGVYAVHLSVLIILAGAAAGTMFSEESYISLPEGDISPVTYPLPDTGAEPVPLGFTIRCDNFEAEFYGKTDTPKLFSSEVTILDDGREVLRKTVKVNDPLTYKGTTFYLSDYGTAMRRLRHGTFIFRVTTKDGASNVVRVPPGDILRIPHSSITGTIVDFITTLAYDERGQAYTYDDRLINPAVHMVFSDSGNILYSGWILKRLPGTGLMPDGNRVEFLDYRGVEYAFFRIRKDPGVRVVYTGLIILGMGLLTVFFMSHKKIWVHLIEEDSNTRLVIAATANRKKDVFKRKFGRIISKIMKTNETLGPYTRL